jgi:hypothetical protein
VDHPHHGIGHGEHEWTVQTTRLVVERLWHGEGHHEQARHRGDHADAQRPLVGLGLVADPGVRNPAEPQQR